MSAEFSERGEECDRVYDLLACAHALYINYAFSEHDKALSINRTEWRLTPIYRKPSRQRECVRTLGMRLIQHILPRIVVTRDT